MDNKIKELKKTHFHLPEKETYEEFIKTELGKSAKDEKDMEKVGKERLKDWITVAPYIMKEAKIPIDRIKGWPVYEEIKKVYDTLVVNSPAKVDPELEKELIKKEDLPEKVVEIKASETTENTADSELIPDVSVPVDIPKVNLVRKSRFGKMSWTYNIKMTKKETSFINIVQVGRKEDEDILLTLDVPKINSFGTIKEFIIAREDLVNRLLNMCIPIGMQKEEPDPDWLYYEHTVWSETGYNLTNFLKNYRARDKNKISDIMRTGQYERKSNKLATFKEYFSVQDKISAYFEELGKVLYNTEEILNNTHENILYMRRFFRSHLAGHRIILKQLPSTYKQGFTYWNFKLLEMDNVKYMQDKSDALAEYMGDALDEQIRRVATITTAGSIEIFSSTMRVIQTSQRHEQKNVIPAKLGSVNIEDVYRRLLYVFLHPERRTATYAVKSMTNVDELILLDSFVFCLFFPSYALSPRMIVDIHNYIVFNFIARTKKFRWANENRGTTAVNYDRDYDYLNDALNAMHDDHTPLRNALRAYFGYQGTNGFAQSGLQGSSLEHEEFIRLINRRVLYYYPYGDRVEFEDKKFDQLVKLERVLSHIDTRTMFKTGGQRERIETVVRLLNAVVNRSQNVTILAAKITQIMDVISISPYASALSNGAHRQRSLDNIARPPQLALKEINFSIGEVSALIFYGNVDEKDIDPLGVDVYRDAMYLEGFLTEIRDRYIEAKKVLTEESEPEFSRSNTKGYKMFQKKDLFDHAFSKDGREYHGPVNLESRLREELEVTHNNYGLKFLEGEGSGNIRITVKEKLREMVRNNPILFGYTRQCVISRYHTLIPTIQHMRFLMHDMHNSKSKTFHYGSAKAESHVYESYDMDKLLELSRNNRLQSSISNNYEKWKPMIFKLPFKYSLKKFFINPKASQLLPFNLGNNNLVIKLGEIDVWYDLEPDYRYIEYYDQEIIINPTVLIPFKDKQEFILNEKGVDALRSCVKYSRRMTHNINEITDDQIFDYSFHSH